MSDIAQKTSPDREKMFNVFKYSIYFLLFLQTFYWFYEDYNAAIHLYPDGVSWTNITTVFAQATDTIAWVFLLFMFELETSVLSDEKLNQGWKWVVNGIAAVCYFFIVLAFWGYILKALFVFGFEPSTFTDACSIIGQYGSYVLDLDDYANLTLDTCGSVQGTLYVNEAARFITTTEMHDHMIMMAVTEVVNAGAWILIVLLLWFDAFLLLRGHEHGRFYKINIVAKFFLYAVLLVACIYWGIDGDFIDFWDAFLWLLAFFFIELNVFKWSEEIEEARDGEEALA
jgi:hypothetical protein